MSQRKRLPPAKGLRNRRVQGFAALLVATGLVSGIVAWQVIDSGSDSAASAPAQTAGDRYKADVLADFAPMSQQLVTFLQTAQQWRDGKAPDDQAAAAVANFLEVVKSSRASLTARAPFPQAPQALENYRQSANLYLQAGEVMSVTTKVGKSDLRKQLQLAIRRLQNLGDRIFDLAGAELAPFMTAAPDYEGVDFRKVAEVPSFGSVQLAAGPPLFDVKGSVEPRDYEESRPEQDFGLWSQSVAKAAVPTSTEEAGALKAGETAKLRDYATRFTKASDLLHDTPDPRGERNLNTRIQLALLVHAEAAQLAQAATLLPAGDGREQLRASAGALAVIGDKLWDSRLGDRTTAFPATLLDGKGRLTD